MRNRTNKATESRSAREILASLSDGDLEALLGATLRAHNSAQPGNVLPTRTDANAVGQRPGAAVAWSAPPTADATKRQPRFVLEPGTPSTKRPRFILEAEPTPENELPTRQAGGASGSWGEPDPTQQGRPSLPGSYDAVGARKAGYSDRQIADHLAGKGNFDAKGARKAGYSDAEIVAHLSSPQTGQKSPKDEGSASQWQPEAPTGYLDALSKIQAGIAHNVANKLQDLPVVGPLYRGGRELAEGATQLIAHTGEKLGITSPETAQAVDGSIADSKQKYEQTPGTWRDIGPIVGGVAASLPILPAVRGAGMASKVLKGGMAGGAYGALTPTHTSEQTPEYWDAKGEQVATGAALGAAAVPVGHVVSRTIAPKVSEAARRLLDANVSLTPGQILGGAVRRIEEGAKSLPIVGDAIASAENRGLRSFNIATINRALANIGQKLPKNTEPGYRAVEDAGARISGAYDNLLPSLTLKADSHLTGELVFIANKAKNIGPRAEQFANILKSEVMAKFSGGQMSGEAMKHVESQLGYYIRHFSRSQDPSDLFMLDALRDTQGALRKALERSNPIARTRLKEINRAFAEFMRIERAAAMQGAKEGIFTPNQLENAVRVLDSSRRKGSFARGKALMQDLATDGGSVLSPRLNNSGTADRLLLNAAALGGGAYLSPAALVGGAAAAGAYTRPMQNALTYLLTKRPAAANALAELVEKTSPAVGPSVGTD